MGRLDGKVAMITGATGGIGQETARHFLAEGAKVMLLGRSKEKLDALQDSLAPNGRVRHFVADATDEDATRRSVAATVAEFGRVDIMFANAGVEGLVKPIHELTLAEFTDVMHSNVTSVWLAIKHCVDAMTKGHGGSIIATASISGGMVGFPTLSAYAASKGAVCGLVKTAALELAGAGIRVNAIAPGPVDNRMVRSVEEQMTPGNPQSARDTVMANVPLHRYASNRDISNFAVFLASDESANCTGGIYATDGGFTAG